MSYYSGFNEQEISEIIAILNRNHVLYELKASNGLLINQIALRKLPESELGKLKSLRVVPEEEGAPIILDIKHGTQSSLASGISSFLFLIMLLIGWWFATRP